jgi:hypothetical protein
MVFVYDDFVLITRRLRVGLKGSTRFRADNCVLAL